MLRQIAYVSSATKPLGPGELDALLARARRNNDRADVTGLLLCDDLSFLQILEGTAEEVQRTLARILRDPRHDGVTVVQDNAISERDFNGWSMAFGLADALCFERARRGGKLDRELLRSLAGQFLPVADRARAGASLYR